MVGVTAMTMDTKPRSRVAPDDLALLERMDLTAMTMDTKPWSRVAADELALFKQMDMTAMTVGRGHQKAESCRSR